MKTSASEHSASNMDELICVILRVSDRLGSRSGRESKFEQEEDDYKLSQYTGPFAENVVGGKPEGLHVTVTRYENVI